MKNAWNLVKTTGITISEGLKKAWAMAKGASKKAFSGVAYIDTGWSTKMFKAWSNYGKHRIYISHEDGRKTYGYIDLDNNNQVVTTNGNHDTNTEAAEIFMAQYAF